MLDILQQILDGGRISYVFAAKLPSPLLTANFHNVSRAAAIASLFKASGSPLAYRLENGVCFVDFAREERGAESDSLPVEERRVSVSVAQAPLSGVLEKMLRQAGASYIIDPALDAMTVTAQLGDVPLSQAIRALTNSSNQRLTVRIAGGVYHFEVTPSATNTGVRR